MSIYFIVFLALPLAKCILRSHFILHTTAFLSVKQQQCFFLFLWSLQLSKDSRELSLYFVLLAAGPATLELHREQSKFSLWKHLYPVQWETSSKKHFAAGLRRLVIGELWWEKKKHCLAAQSSAPFSQNLATFFIMSEGHFHTVFKLFITPLKWLIYCWQNWILFLFLIPLYPAVSFPTF